MILKLNLDYDIIEHKTVLSAGDTLLLFKVQRQQCAYDDDMSNFMPSIG